MSLETFSVFYYDYEITEDNKYLNFDEGSGELTAIVALGDHSWTQLCLAVQSALNDVGTQVYTVTPNRSDRTVTIEGDTSNFTLKITTGVNASAAVFGLLGFTGADVSGADTFTGNSQSGSEYYPQFILQDHISSDNSQRAVEGTVRKSASGVVEVVRFGVETFVQMNIRFATNKAMDGKVIKSNATGIEDLQAFMQHLITKAPVEFMPNLNARNTFETLILESTRADRNGIGYELRELYNKGLPGFFDTGIMKFRVV